jgi:hypothetical protein
LSGDELRVLADGDVGKAVDPGRTTGLEDGRGDVLPPKAPPAAHGNVLACPTPDGDYGDRTVVGTPSPEETWVLVLIEVAGVLGINVKPAFRFGHHPA